VQLWIRVTAERKNQNQSTDFYNELLVEWSGEDPGGSGTGHGGAVACVVFAGLAVSARHLKI